MNSATPRSARVLVLNAGSSTLKYALFEESCLVESETLELVGTATIQKTVHSLCARETLLPIDVIAYRVVHGGVDMISPVEVTPGVVAKLKATVHLAPLHQKPAIEAMETAMVIAPNAFHVACFDTAFHATMPAEEKLLALPREMYDLGIRRFGFHGLSYESIVHQLSTLSARAAQGRTVVCHLGNGASLCGMIGSQSKTTTMSFTPQDGLIMGTRAGRLDSGVILHLLQNNYSAQDVQQILTKRSGLLGISSVSSDMRELMRRSPEHFESHQAITMFCNSVAREIVSAATFIGGLDALVFTAGIGENCDWVRSHVVKKLAWIGGELDEAKNQANATQLHASTSSFEILRVATDEQSIIAEHARTIWNHAKSLATKPTDE
jgi:acetate kinase